MISIKFQVVMCYSKLYLQFSFSKVEIFIKRSLNVSGNKRGLMLVSVWKSNMFSEPFKVISKTFFEISFKAEGTDHFIN